MEIYSGFAGLYDDFMDQVPYRQWSAWITDKLRGLGISDGLVLDLGCGTGSLAILLKQAGYDMIGVDGSPEMLAEARQKYQDPDILFLCQDMRSFELYGTVRAVVSVCDSLNYILDPEELRQVFALVRNYLDPGGAFIFDMNTAHKYLSVGDTVIAENRPDSSFIWENAYDAGECINEYAVTFYQQEENGLYRRFEETHYQKAYRREDVETWLLAAGFAVEGVFDGYSGDPWRDATQRMVFVCRGAD